QDRAGHAKRGRHGLHHSHSRHLSRGGGGRPRWQGLVHRVLVDEHRRRVAGVDVLGEIEATYSSACMMTGATATTDRPLPIRITRTPWVARPALRTCEAATRITWPSLAMTRMSWSFRMGKAPASTPTREVSMAVFTPSP